MSKLQVHNISQKAHRLILKKWQRIGKNYKFPIFFLIMSLSKLFTFWNNTNFLTPLRSIGAIFYQSRSNVYCKINWVKKRHILTSNFSSLKKTQCHGMLTINWTQARSRTNVSFGNMHKLLKLRSLVESQYVDLIQVFSLSLKIARYRQKPWGRYKKDAKKRKFDIGWSWHFDRQPQLLLPTVLTTRSKCVVITPLHSSPYKCYP